jgi:hypothetical protein
LSLKDELQRFSHKIHVTTTAEFVVGINANEMEPVTSSKDIFLTEDIMYDMSSHSGGYEEFSPLGYNDAQSIESHTMFRRNKSRPSLVLNSSPSKKPA